MYADKLRDQHSLSCCSLSVKVLGRRFDYAHHFYSSPFAGVVGDPRSINSLGPVVNSRYNDTLQPCRALDRSINAMLRSGEKRLVCDIRQRSWLTHV